VELVFENKTFVRTKRGKDLNSKLDIRRKGGRRSFEGGGERGGLKEGVPGGGTFLYPGIFEGTNTQEKKEKSF